MTRRFSVSAIVSLFLILNLTPSFAANIKDGDPCAPAGATFKQGTTNFECTKYGTKTVWRKKTAASPTSTAEATFVMPKVVGMNLQLAQDLLQSKGSYLMDQQDFKKLGRFQIIDSNWKVCSQSPAAGKKLPISTIVTLASVKLSESCR